MDRGNATVHLRGGGRYGEEPGDWRDEKLVMIGPDGPVAEFSVALMKSGDLRVELNGVTRTFARGTWSQLLYGISPE